MQHKQTEFVIIPLVQSTYDRETIDLKKIIELSSKGLDEVPPEDRALAWLALIGLYPINPTKWTRTLSDTYQSYWDYVKAYGLENWHLRNIPNQCQREIFNLNNNSLMAIIHGDIVRTGRIIFFFPTKTVLGNYEPEKDDLLFQFGEHLRRLERILYVFSSLNVGFGYMQGYNELLPPFYYVLLLGQTLLGNSIENIEALAFQCFQTLIISTKLHELYMTGQKSEEILRNLNNFTKIMKIHLPLIFEKLDLLGIHPLLYCYRWFNLLFSQEHDLPSILTIWDSLFAHFDNLVEYTFYVGLGHLKLVENKVLQGDYGLILSTLQKL